MEILPSVTGTSTNDFFCSSKKVDIVVIVFKGYSVLKVVDVNFTVLFFFSLDVSFIFWRYAQQNLDTAIKKYNFKHFKTHL